MARRSAAALRRQKSRNLAAAAAAEAVGDDGQSEQGGNTPATNTPGADTPAADDDDDEDDDAQPVASTSAAAASAASRLKFVVVSDHGQTTLVPFNKAHNYRSITGRDGEQAPPSLPAQNEDESGASTPAPRKKKLIRVQIKRGRGRPPKKAVKPRYEFIEEDDDDDDEEDEDAATPMDDAATPDDGTPRAGGGAEDEMPAPVEVDVHIDGKRYTLKNDELLIDDDEVGDAKIDAKGQLLGGREFSFPVFQSAQRPDPTVWYALSIDAAKGCGYTSSFFFYRRNPLLIKLACTDKEKEWCIEHGRLPAHLRTRSVNMVAVRNVFKLHGAKVIKGGRFVTDDYYEKAAREAGKVEGQLVEVPSVENEYDGGGVRTSDRRQRESERDRNDRSRRRPDAFTYAGTDLHGNPWFTTFGDTGEAPFERAKAWPTRRVNALRTELNEHNWMMEMAASVRGMNRELMTGRLERLRAFGRPYEAIEGVPEEEEMSGPAQKTEAEEDVSMSNSGNGGDDSTLSEVAEPAAAALPPTKKRKAASAYLPIGLYEPLTNLPHYSTLTQSRWATFERVHERPIVPDATAKNGDARRPQQQRAVLGGARVGAHAWGVASIEQRVTLPLPRTSHDVRLSAGASYYEMDM